MKYIPGIVLGIFSFFAVMRGFLTGDWSALYLTIPGWLLIVWFFSRLEKEEKELLQLKEKIADRREKTKTSSDQDSVSIGYYFAIRGIAESNPITSMKIQKLIYMAHGSYMAKYNKPLIKDRFKAWKWGPVIPLWYDIAALYGSDPITDLDLLEIKTETESIELRIAALTQAQQHVLNDVWEHFKDAPYVRIADWTMKQGGPWSNHYIPGDKDSAIPNEEIKLYFQQYNKNNHEAKA